MRRRNFSPTKVANVSSQIREWLGNDAGPTIAVTLGSGLGGFVENLAGARSIKYHEVGLPETSAAGHAGKLWYGKIGTTEVIVLQGRAHRYEGHDLQDVVLGVRALEHLGAKTHILTCAAGGVNSEFTPGQIVVVNDHINMTWDSPLEGINADTVGPRFVDMTYPYDHTLRDTARAAGKEMSLELRLGVYAMMPGPAYETKAEVRALRTLGADLVGMSTVPEVLALRHMSARVLAFALVSNKAAGVTENPLSHQEVMETATNSAETFGKLLVATIKKIASDRHPA